MSARTINLSEALYEYMLSVSLRENSYLEDLRRETAKMENMNMQISPEQGQFMALLIQLTGAKRTIEVGVFTGYSSLAVALALPDDGHIVACDVSEAYTAVAQRFWEKAGTAHKIDLRLAPAVETLDALIQADQANSYDFAFIDADKENYDTYYERCLKLLRPGGLIAIDNVLWGGKLLKDLSDDPTGAAIDALNKKLVGDDRVDISLVPIGDGLTLLRKR